MSYDGYVTRPAHTFEHNEREIMLRLAGIRARIEEAEADLRSLKQRYESVASESLPSNGNIVDVALLRRIEDYKMLLESDIDRKRVDIDALALEERDWLHQAEAARRRRDMVPQPE